MVELSVVCEGSLALAERVAARELDMAVVTSCMDLKGAEALREEPLHWFVGATSRAHEMRPLPLALSGPTCSWRARAIKALNDRGILWRQLLASANQVAISPVVLSGIAVSVMPPSAMRAGMRILDERDGLPEIGSNAIGLLEGRGKQTDESLALAEEIRARCARARGWCIPRPPISSHSMCPACSGAGPAPERRLEVLGKSSGIPPSPHPEEWP